MNGTIIAYDPVETQPDRVTYDHVETEAHDVILANGAAAETYVDYYVNAANSTIIRTISIYAAKRKQSARWTRTVFLLPGWRHRRYGRVLQATLPPETLP